MILRPQVKDLRIIGFYLGKIVVGFALFMIFPMAVSLLAGEIDPFFDFLISFLLCAAVGMTLHIFCYIRHEPRWSHGMIIVSFSWIITALLGAVPLYLSQHFNSFLDAFFEAMSGLTTTGLSLVQDLSHMSYGHNLWRHLTGFIGGQGVVVVVLSVFVHGAAGAYKLYVGEGREERLLPNVRQTARFIWSVSLIYLIIGTAVLGGILFLEGMPWIDALFHGVCLFIAGFDTMGFAPQAQNIMFYHSVAFEVALMVIMFLGSLNFLLHYAVWMGNRKEMIKNVEIFTFFLSIILLFAAVAVGLTKTHVYPTAIALFRKGFFHLFSAHTTTGFQSIYSSQFITEWESLSLFGVLLAMSIGGCICSTTGGIKALRLNLMAKAFKTDIKRYVSPEAMVFVEKIHHVKDMVVNEKQLLAAFMIALAYISTFFIGALVGMLCGYPFIEALFESISANGNVGLSCGVTDVSMPAILKFTYIFEMWAGRLEFMSVFVLLGFILALVKGK